MTMRILSILLFSVMLSSCFQVPPVVDSLTSSGKVHIGEKATGTGGFTRIETINTAMPHGTPSVPGHGKEVGLMYGAITGADRTIANGVAMSHQMEDHSSIVGVQVNIVVPADGYFYEAWLSTPDESKRITLGHLTNPFNDVRHSVRMESAQNLSAFTVLTITLEKDDGDTAPSSTVASAILKPTSR